MFVHHLTSVDGEIVFDIDPDVVGTAAGGTRVADDVSVEEVSLLARAMTYKFAVFEQRLGGAKAGIRPRLLDTHGETMARYCEEIQPMVAERRFLTGADLGTTTADFEPLLPPGPRPMRVIDSAVGGVAFEELVTGRGVTAAAAAWLGGLEGRTVAIEGFGAAGGGVARDVVRRGGLVVAVSTADGAVADGAGLDVDALFEARAEHGDAFVNQLGFDVHRPVELHRLAVDVLVPGARTGIYDAAAAAEVQATVISPAANVPYTVAGLEILRANGVVALPDFVCNAGAVLAYQAPGGLPPHEVLDRVDRLIGERVESARTARMDPIEHATVLADTFLATWIPEQHQPDGPALVP
ncbi:MAG: Glu/Leu/Phe/Val dehydrogenase dimerization domain-containing protein [Acidimicrobiales bacterium]